MTTSPYTADTFPKSATPPCEAHPYAGAVFAGTISEEEGPTIIVIDPASRKLLMPLCYVYETQALNRIDRVPSICMLFMNNSCRQGVMCHQLHADVATVTRLRHDIQSRPACCAHHGDAPLSVDPLPKFGGIAIEKTSLTVPSACLSWTKGLMTLLHDHTAEGWLAEDATVPATKTFVCRLHISGRCRFAEDCNFLHVCRGIITEQTPGFAPMVSPAVRPVLAGAARPAAMMTPPMSYAMAPPPPPYGAHAAGYDSPTMSPMKAAAPTYMPPTAPPTPLLSGGGRSTPPEMRKSPWKHDPYAWQALPPSAVMASA